jgi:hypothetical protein
MTKEKRDEIVARALQTKAGQAQFRRAFQAASAAAADRFPEGSLGWFLGRKLAGLPFRFPRRP